jgi:hypothetical protein
MEMAMNGQKRYRRKEVSASAPPLYLDEEVLRLKF